MEDQMDHFVMLERLPEGLEFPANLRDRIRYDPQTKKLFFRGYMSKTHFDHLCELSRDWSFRRKLEELFQICIDAESPRAPGNQGWFAFFRKRAMPS
jgi:hypothetical protein